MRNKTDSICNFNGRLSRIMAFLGLLTALTSTGLPEGLGFNSRWDESLLKTEFAEVNIKPKDIRAAWQEMGNRYLLRSNLYMDSEDATEFSFKKQGASGKEVFDAFVATYSAYTYTQDPKTGVIWIHPKRIPYDAVLNQQIEVRRAACQILMFNQVYAPLSRLLAPNQIPFGVNRSLVRGVLNYPMDLPEGVFAARDIINFCCVADPTKAFAIEPPSTGRLGLMPLNLHYGNPTAPPRARAISFWEVEIGQPLTPIPSVDELVSALSDSNPRRRWAARAYLKATYEHYREPSLIAKCDEPRKAIWVAIALKSIDQAGRGDQPYITVAPFAQFMQGFTNDLPRMNPALGLLAAMECAREKNDPRFMDAVADHKFSGDEIESIQPDLNRIARESTLVRDKLIAWKSDVRELSAEVLSGLARTNLLEPIPEVKK
jgi:hypothetical protein